MISARKKGAILSYVFMALEILSSLLFTPLLIRTLGQSEYGVYSLVASITSYLYLFDLGIGNSIVRYMAKYRAQEDEGSQRSLLSVTLVFYAIIGVVVIAVGLVLQRSFGAMFGVGLSPEQIQQGKAMLFITMLNAAATLVFAPYSKTIIAFERFGFSKLSDIVKIILRITVSVAVLKLGGRGLAIVTVNLVMTVIFGIVSGAYVTYELKLLPGKSKPERGFLKEIFSYSLVIFVQMVATQLNAMVDQVIMGMAVASSAVIIGVYAVGAQITAYFQSFAAGINGVIMPGIVKMVETTRDSKVYEDEMVRIGRLLFMFLGIIYVVFLFAGREFVCLWAGAENESAYYVACIIMMPLTFWLSQSIGSQFLWALDKHKVQTVLQISVALANIVLTWFMIKWNPLIGASLATGITYFAGNVVVANVIFKRDMGISIRAYYAGLFKGILPCLAVVGAVGFALCFLRLGTLPGFAVKSAAMIIVYCVGMYFYGMNPYEKNIINSILYRIVGGKGNVQK